MKRVLFLPAGDRDTPSSRLICYENSKHLKRLGWPVAVGGDPNEFDIIIFQKRLDTPDFLLAQKLKGKKRIVFQLSEAYYLKPNWAGAVRRFAKLADVAVAGTPLIQNYFKKLHRPSVIIPTGLDFAALPKGSRKPPVKICWIGSLLNERYLRHMIAPLNELWRSTNFTLRVIGGQRPRLPFKGKRHFIQWKLNEAERQVSECHIGIAPLDCKPFEYAKSPSKPILYMAQGLAVVATDTPTYRTLIRDGVNGFLIQNNDRAQWTRVLRELITNAKKRNAIAAAGHKACQPYNAPNIARKWDAFLRTL